MAGKPVTAGTPRRTASLSPLRLDRRIHERLRLGIVSALAANPRMTFQALKERLQTTDGNLLVHARKLEEAGYVGSRKTSAGGAPRTVYRLTPAGRRAFERYLGQLKAIIAAARNRGR